MLHLTFYFENDWFFYVFYLLVVRDKFKDIVNVLNRFAPFAGVVRYDLVQHVVFYIFVLPC